MPSTQDKTEKPTARRREKARQEGQVVQSIEVNNTLVLLAATGALAMFWTHTLGMLAGQVADRLGHLGGVGLSQDGVCRLVREAFQNAGLAVMPVVVLAAIVALLSSVAQTGLLLTPKKLAPNLKYIDPVRGLKNLFSLQALVRLLVAVAKLTLISLIAYLVLRHRWHWIFALIGKSVWGVLEATRQICLSLMFRIVLAMLGVAMLDYAYKRWRQERQLMMSRQEVKDEHRMEEGDPKIRSRQWEIRFRMVRARISQAVPTADVVVTNPTHVAVALRWDEKTMSAPCVVAKGRGYVAERIRRIALHNGVPVLERRWLARALYEAVEVGMEIPPKLYYAVAEVLAFVLRRRGGAPGAATDQSRGSADGQSVSPGERIDATDAAEG